jgi:transposase, IS5 family
MLSKSDRNPQLNLMEVPLIQFINKKHELYLLSSKIDWDSLEKDFAEYYSKSGAPSVPVRCMVGLNLLKMIYEMGDTSILDHWVENPYWQYFCGEVNFKHEPPCSVSEFNHFHKRIGKEGEAKIKKLAVSVFGKARIDKGLKALERRKKGQNKGVSGFMNVFGFKRGK